MMRVRMLWRRKAAALSMTVLSAFASSCSGNYKLIIYHNSGDILAAVLDNNLFGGPKAGSTRSFCLYSADVFDSHEIRVWRIQSKTGLCTEMQSVSFLHIPRGYVESGAVPDLKHGVYTVKMAIGGGSATAELGRAPR